MATKRKSDNLGLLALEPRWMFDGAAVAAMDQSVADTHSVPAAVEVRAADPAQNSGRKEVAFVDTSVAGYQALEASIRSGVSVVEFGGGEDGLAQMAQWAEGHAGFDSISILSHGTEATLKLGTTLLDVQSMFDATVKAELAELGQALKLGGDLLLYACDTAKGADGLAFMNLMGARTGADVAASTDDTGSTEAGGNWVLEASVGTIDTPPVVTSAPDFQGVLTAALVFASTGDGTTGSELWISDGTTAGTTLLKDIQSGANGSSPNYFVALGNKVVFKADDGTHGTELWVTDGTAAGTNLLKEASLGAANSYTRNLTLLGNKVLFQAYDTTNGYELWSTDGTTAGTALVKDIYPGDGSSSPGNITVIGDKAVFSAFISGHGTELWVTDGTTAGTSLVKEIVAGAGDGQMAYFTALGNRAIFRADGGGTGWELWVTDGTTAGTSLLKDINPGAARSDPKALVKLSGKVLFSANDGAHGYELWATDGTTAGTALVKDIATGADNSVPINLKAIGDKVFFGAYSGAIGTQLWVTDGTEAGTTLVKDINPASGSNPAEFAEVGGKVVFAADDGSNGTELWVTDGTTGGTTLLKDIKPGASGSSPTNFVAFGNKLAFKANSKELWVTDGTSAGTTLVKSFNVGYGSGLSGLAISNFGASGGGGGGGGGGATTTTTTDNHGPGPSPQSTTPPTAVKPAATAASAPPTTEVTVMRDRTPAPKDSFTQSPVTTGRTDTTATISLTPTGQLTALSGEGAFRVPVISEAQRAGIGGDGLIAVRPVAQVQTTESGINFTIPADTFAHTRADAVVNLTAAQMDGQALPPWLTFNPKTGAFVGTPPPGLEGVVVVQVVARDQNGREAVATIRINVGEKNAPAGGQRTGEGKPVKLGHHLRDKPVGKVAFTQQLKLAARNAAIRFF